MKKHHIIAAAITLASGMSAISQDTAAPWHNEQSKRLPSGLLGPIAIEVAK